MKGRWKIFFSRMAVVTLTIIGVFILECLIIAAGIWILKEWMIASYPEAQVEIDLALGAILYVIVVIAVIHIVNRDMIPEAKLTWMFTVMTLNVFGVAIYIVFSHNRPTRKQRRVFAQIAERTACLSVRCVGQEQSEEALGKWAGLSEELNGSSPLAVLYPNTATEYLPTGEIFFERLKEDLRAAKKYIFLEYFIVERGEMFDGIFQILKEKVEEGVEVRFIYDDIGSIGKVPSGFYKKLRKAGIACVKFSPYVPIISNVHNNRDHRKIAVIDGMIGYTGGINLADEYTNKKKLYGEWKDTAVRLEGEGVRSLVLMFLQVYNLYREPIDDFAAYLPEEYPVMEESGYVQPYGSGPLPAYHRSIGENVYLNILHTARNYVYIATPYLIIDERMKQALLGAAERGVDVRILVPHIPDKKIVFALTRSNYTVLLKGGVKIYEYTPGFVHEKCFLADDETGVVGTINLDYRSFLHHYECAVLMVKTKAIAEMKEDILASFEKSQLITEEAAKKSGFMRIVWELVKVFAPLF